MEAKPIKKYKVLWADDDTDDLDMFRDVLVELTPDYEIIEFENGKEALDHLETLDEGHYPCLIILDMNMPVLSGRDTLIQLKKDIRYHEIPVVVFTTSSSLLDKLFCKQHNTDMLTKPPSFESLKEVVQKLITYCRPLSKFLKTAQKNQNFIKIFIAG
jgi:CheY-like chemotaxis protein